MNGVSQKVLDKFVPHVQPRYIYVDYWVVVAHDKFTGGYLRDDGTILHINMKRKRATVANGGNYTEKQSIERFKVKWNKLVSDGIAYGKVVPLAVVEKKKSNFAFKTGSNRVWFSFKEDGKTKDKIWG